MVTSGPKNTAGFAKLEMSEALAAGPRGLVRKGVGVV